jgi:hypothetical protein
MTGVKNVVDAPEPLRDLLSLGVVSGADMMDPTPEKPSPSSLTPETLSPFGDAKSDLTMHEKRLAPRTLDLSNDAINEHLVDDSPLEPDAAPQAPICEAAPSTSIPASHPPISFATLPFSAFLAVVVAVGVGVAMGMSTYTPTATLEQVRGISAHSTPLLPTHLYPIPTPIQPSTLQSCPLLPYPFDHYHCLPSHRSRPSPQPGLACPPTATLPLSRRNWAHSGCHRMPPPPTAR